MSEDKKTKFMEAISSLAREFFYKLGMDGTIDVIDDEAGSHCFIVSVNTNQKTDDLTSRDGDGLRSAEHVFRLIASRKISQDVQHNFALDINDYRKTKVSYLIKLARDVASRVRISRKAEALNPMPSYERRLIHLELASCPDITTESIGEDPKRRVVIKPL